jgi:peroxiredoxin
MKYGLSIFIMLFGCLLFSCIREEVPAGQDVVKPGDVLPDFSVVLNDGSELSRKSLEGKVAVLVFFHTGCPDCRKELPIIQQLYEEYAAHEGAGIYAISREEGREEVGDYWAENSLTIPYSAQDDRRIYELFSTSGIPRVYVCGQDGRIVSMYSDNPIATYSQLKADVENTLNFSSYLFAEQMVSLNLPTRIY